MPERPPTPPADPVRLQHEQAVNARGREVIRRLAPGIHHDLNNSLASLGVFVKMLREDSRLPDDLRADAALAAKESERATRLIGDLLRFLRDRPEGRQPAALGGLVEQVLHLLADPIFTTRVEVRTEVDREVPPVPVARAELTLVVLDLALHALDVIRAGRGSGPLTFVVRRGGETAELAIEHGGPGGLPEPDARSVADVVARDHGGELRLETGGSIARFVVALPIPPDEQEAAGQADEAGPQPARQPEPAASGHRRVLVVDDEEAIRRFLAKALAIAGSDAVLAATGAEAVDLARVERFDAVLCDYRMAGMTGTDVYHAITGMRPELGRRFVFMSGDIHHPELAAFAGVRGLGLLAKPFEIDSVRHALAQVFADET